MTALAKEKAKDYQRAWRAAHPGYQDAWNLAHPGKAASYYATRTERNRAKRIAKRLVKQYGITPAELARRPRQKIIEKTI